LRAKGRDFRLFRAGCDLTSGDVDHKLGGLVEVPGALGATRLRVVAEVSGQFSQEESAPLLTAMEEPPPKPLKPDAPAVMTSRFEPKDTATAYSALDRLAKIPEARILGGRWNLTACVRRMIF
jgi:hypothetical protein